MRNSRLFQILYLLMAKNGMTASELAARTEVSKRTIQRDVDALSAAGIPIYTTRGRGGGVFLMPEFVLDKSLLSTEEQSEILYALKSLQAAGIDNNLAERLEGQFGAEHTDWIDIHFSYWGASSTDRALFAQLKQAILEKRVLTFAYYASDGTHSARTIHPYRLSFRSLKWYVQGFCCNRKAFRTFKLARMRNVSVLRDTFVRTQAPPPLDTVTWETHASLLHLIFETSVAFQVYDMFASDSITWLPDGRIQVIQMYPDTDWTVQFLLSFGAAVKVIDPPHLRKAIRDAAKKILSQY